MTYKRVVERNHLQGDYEYREPFDPAYNLQHLIAGDLRRLEADQRDEKHLEAYAKLAGITPEQVRIVLNAFFGSLAFVE